jgi:hypothetical protein
MFVDYNQMPAQARIWIYQAPKNLNTNEQIEIGQAAQKFIEQWTAHQQTLRASYQIKYDRFLIIALDESLTAASGCSIDSSVNFLRAIAQNYQIDFLDRSQVAYWQNDTIQNMPLAEIKRAVQNGEILPETIIFNNSLTMLSDLADKWQIQAQDSWLARYFVPQKQV